MAKARFPARLTRVPTALFVLTFFCATLRFSAGDDGVTVEYNVTAATSPNTDDSNIVGTLTSDNLTPGGEQLMPSPAAPSTQTSDETTPGAEQIVPSPAAPSTQTSDETTPGAERIVPSPAAPSTQTSDETTSGAEQIVPSPAAPSTQTSDEATPGAEQIVPSLAAPSTQTSDETTPGAEQIVPSPAAPSTQTSVEATPGAEEVMPIPAVPGLSDSSSGEINDPSLTLKQDIDTIIGEQDVHPVIEEEDAALLDEQTSESEMQPSSTVEQETDNDAAFTITTTEPELLLGEPEFKSLYSLGRRASISGEQRISQCGGRGRIIGGLESTVGAWPWAVVIKDKFGAHFCGGALISLRHVLTAAHCIEHPDLADRLPLQVTVGEHDISRSDESVSRTEWVHQALTHNQYNMPSPHNNDIGVLVLQNAVDDQDNVAPACLPSAQFQLPVGTKLFVVGWGATMENGPVVDVLRQVQVTVLPHSSCTAVYSQYREDRMFCVGDAAGGKDACQGDSGGPLLHQDGNGKWVVVGVVSFGTGCGRQQYPGVYTNVPFHLGLITWALDQV